MSRLLHGLRATISPLHGDIPIRMVDISELTVGLSAHERRYLRLHGFMLQQ